MAAEALAIAADRTIHREVLPNGLTILTEQMDHIRSVSMGIWLNAGSRNEEPEVNGISHFVEHMVFKGTSRRSAEDIAREVDSIGGNMDAFTGKETVCFNIKVLDEHLPIAVDVLSDMVLHPVFDEAEVARERGVILEEIKMTRTTPTASCTRFLRKTPTRASRWAGLFWGRRKRCGSSSRRRRLISNV